MNAKFIPMSSTLNFCFFNEESDHLTLACTILIKKHYPNNNRNTKCLYFLIQ